MLKFLQVSVSVALTNIGSAPFDVSFTALDGSGVTFNGTEADLLKLLDEKGVPYTKVGADVVVLTKGSKSVQTDVVPITQMAISALGGAAIA